VFRLVADAVVFSGDTLFAGSIGRTDLPGGSTRQLLDGISRHLLALPPETRVLSGHGPATTIGRELDANPYLG
jgi:glyoxylase-like metal-dependent hydrolase (beta-lactamase superfamily II)